MFKRSMTGRVTLHLEDFERNVLQDFIREFSQLVAMPEEPAETDPLARMLGMNGPTKISDDPALARLFPHAYLDDEEAAADFRRYTEPELRDVKVKATQTVLESMALDAEKITLSETEQQAWLQVLNDLRLVLGVRLNISEGEREDPDEPMFQVYDWMTWLQGTLIDSIA